VYLVLNSIKYIETGQNRISEMGDGGTGTNLSNFLGEQKGGGEKKW